MSTAAFFGFESGIISDDNGKFHVKMVVSQRGLSKLFSVMLA